MMLPLIRVRVPPRAEDEVVDELDRDVVEEQRADRLVEVEANAQAAREPGPQRSAHGAARNGQRQREHVRRAAVQHQAPGDERQSMHFALTRVYETLMGTGTWPSALKASLNMIGVPAGLPREPVQPLSPADTAKLEAVLREVAVLPA